MTEILKEGVRIAKAGASGMIGEGSSTCWGGAGMGNGFHSESLILSEEYGVLIRPNTSSKA